MLAVCKAEVDRNITKGNEHGRYAAGGRLYAETRLSDLNKQSISELSLIQF
jgi:hypothetical protein